LAGVPVTGAGEVVSSMNQHVSESDWTETPVIGFDGANYLVVWHSWSGVYGARANTDTVLDVPPITIATRGARSPAIAFGMGNYLVVWDDIVGGNDIYGSRVSPDGEVLDSVGIVICMQPDSQCMPAVASDGSNYLVVWQDKRNGSDWDIYAVRVTPGGEVIGTNSIAICCEVGDQKYPAIAFGNTTYLIVWEDHQGGETTLRHTCVSREGRLPCPVDILKNYPNPFSTFTHIQYRLKTSMEVELSIYDKAGRPVKIVKQGLKPPGTHTAFWDGKNNSGKSVANGTYFCRLMAGEFCLETKTVMIANE
jgi:hypothetical protein